MPRGNDAAAVRQENAQRFGRHVNVEQLIRAQAGEVSPALLKASKVGLNEEATKLVRDDFESFASKFDLPEGDTVVDLAVRGNTLIAVVEGGRDGQIRKEMAGYTDDWAPPKLTVDEQSQADRAQAERDAARKMDDIQSEADRRVQEAREAADAEVSAEMARIEREKDERLAALAGDEAEVQAEAEAEGVAQAADPQPGAKSLPPPDQGVDKEVEALEDMTGAELDRYAAKAKIADYPKSAKVGERRKHIASALKAR